MKDNKITTQEEAISFIQEKGFEVRPSFKNHVSIIKNGSLYNIIKESELIKQALYLKSRTHLLT